MAPDFENRANFLSTKSLLRRFTPTFLSSLLLMMLISTGVHAQELIDGGRIIVEPNLVGA